jgi:hypothetical protein
MIAAAAASGSCLGPVGGDIWSRVGVNPIPHGQRPLAERELVHWVDTAEQAKQVVRSAALMAVVADREADIYPLWGTMPDPRAMSERSLVGGGMLFAAAAEFPVAGLREIELPACDPGQRKRNVLLELRYGAVEIRHPRAERDHNLPPSMAVSPFGRSRSCACEESRCV